MTPQKSKTIMVALFCIALFMMLIAMAGFTIASETKEPPSAIPVIALITGFALVLAGGIVDVMFWICPHCKEYLGRGSAKYCKHCGKPLEKETMSHGKNGE